jgi:hypothetical protein
MNITTVAKMPLPDPQSWIALTEASYPSLALFGIIICYILFQYFSGQSTKSPIQIESLKTGLANFKV